MGLGTATTTPVRAQKEVPVYTFELRSDAVFKDGTPLTAEDVKWTFERMITLDKDAAFLLSDMIHSIEVVDDTHVSITLLDDFAFFEPILTSEVASVIKKDSVPVDEGADGLDGTIAWGSGPYRMTSEVRDVETVFIRNPDYWGDPAKNAKVTVTYYASNALVAVALEAGDIDLAFRHIDPEKIIDWIGNDADDIETTMPPSTQVRYIVFPNETMYPHLTKGVRQAIGYAVDRQGIIDGAWSGLTSPAYTMVPPGFLGHYPTFPDRNLDMAKDLLTAEGYSVDNKFELDLWYSPTHYGTTEPSIAAIVKVALEETGMMTVNINFVEWAEYREKWRATAMEAFLLGWYPDYLDVDNYLYSFYHSSGSRWGPKPDPPNHALDSLLYNARLTPDRDIRNALYEQASMIAADEVKVLPLWYGYQFAAWQNDVTGVVLGPDMTIRFDDMQKGATIDGELRVGTTDKIISLDYADTYD